MLVLSCSFWYVTFKLTWLIKISQYFAKFKIAEKWPIFGRKNLKKSKLSFNPLIWQTKRIEFEQFFSFGSNQIRDGLSTFKHSGLYDKIYTNLSSLNKLLHAFEIAREDIDWVLGAVGRFITGLTRHKIELALPLLMKVVFFKVDFDELYKIRAEYFLKKN
jgi:hypothetical protein